MKCDSCLPHFLIINSYTTYNKGDAAIVLGMLKTITKFYPNSEISILTSTPREDEKYYCRYGAKTYSRLFNTTHIKNKKYLLVIICIDFFFRIISYLIWSKLKFFPIGKSDKTILELYEKADLVITCGGGYLGGKKYSTLLAHLFPMYLAKKLRKKIYVYAQSVEPFSSNIVRFLTKFILDNTDLITVREPNSYEVLKSINIKTALHITADPAFLVDEEPKDSGLLLLKKAGLVKNNNLLVGITVRKWNFPTSMRPDLKQTIYLNAISSALERMVKEMGANVVLFPQVIFAPYDDDREIGNQIRSTVDKSLREKILVLRENYSTEQIKSMIGNMNIFVGTRMHSNIFAISMKIPTLAIAYEHKTYGIMKMLELDEYVVDISNVTADILMESVRKLLRDRDVIVRKIEKRLPVLQKEAVRNGEFIKELLEKIKTK